MPPRSDFIEPCLPSTADQPPSGPEWIHEIKHDGYRLMTRRDPIGIRLLTRRGNDWSERFPRVVEAVNLLKVRSCLIDGEVVCCDERGVAAFHVLRRRRNEPEAFLYAGQYHRPHQWAILVAPLFVGPQRTWRHLPVADAVSNP
jgi:bifunctional non-homologous end joining protein LigD